jgi:hypothetical protein
MHPKVMEQAGQLLATEANKETALAWCDREIKHSRTLDGGLQLPMFMQYIEHMEEVKQEINRR